MTSSVMHADVELLTPRRLTLASILKKAPLYLQIRIVSHSNIASKREGETENVYDGSDRLE